jgi:hypothetical protein
MQAPSQIPFPPTLDGFEVEGQTLAGRHTVIARRNGVTWVFIRHQNGLWDAEKIKGGKIIGRTRRVRRLPKPIEVAVLDASPVTTRFIV